MVRSLFIAAGLASALCGWALAVYFRHAPQWSAQVWVFPLALLIAGGWLLQRYWGWLRTLAALVLVALPVYFLALLVWPSGPVPTAFKANGPALPSAPALKQRQVLLAVPPQYRQGPLAALRRLNVADGLQISVFAAGLGAPRFMALHPEGDILVSLPGRGEVVALGDGNRDGIADRQVVVASGLDRPHGVAFLGKDLVIAETGRLLLVSDDDGDRRADRQRVLSDLPGGGGHWTRTVVADDRGGLFVSAGSSCNACIEDDPRRAAVLRFSAAGGKGEIFARGLRNSVGLALHPTTGELWGSDNGRDHLGDNLPPEEINRLTAGGDYGWPFCYGQRIPDPDFGSAERCREITPPEVEMPAHSAPLGIAFGQGLDLPPPYPDLLYVAYHGSWNRREPTGYKLVGIPFQAGRPSGPPIDIVSGWLEGETAWGRPVAPLVGADGALYLSDDRAGAIYRISRIPGGGTAGQE